MSIYKHHLDPDRRGHRRQQPQLEEPHSPHRRLDRPIPIPTPTSASTSASRSNTSTSSSSAVLSRANASNLSSSAVLSRANASSLTLSSAVLSRTKTLRLAELHGNAVEERGRLSGTSGEAKVVAKTATLARGGNATKEVGGVDATATPRTQHASPSTRKVPPLPHRPKLELNLPHGRGQTKRRREPSPVDSISDLSSLSSLSDVEEGEKDDGDGDGDEGEDGEPERKRVKVRHDIDGVGDGETSSYGEDQGGLEELDDDDNCDGDYSKDTYSSSSEDDDASEEGPDEDYEATPTTKAEYRTPMSMRLQQRMVVGMSESESGRGGEGGGEEGEDTRERNAVVVKANSKPTSVKAGLGRGERRLRARSGLGGGRSTTTSIPHPDVTPSTPSAPLAPLRTRSVPVSESIPTSTRLQERRFRANEAPGTLNASIFKGTPGEGQRKRVRWELDADADVGTGAGVGVKSRGWGRGRGEERGEAPLSMRLQARMLREREAMGVGVPGVGGIEPPGEVDLNRGDDAPWVSGRRNAPAASEDVSATPSIRVGETDPGDDFTPLVPSASEDTVGGEEDDDGSTSGSEVESGDEDEGDDDESDADAEYASRAPVDAGRAWLSGVRETRATGRALKEILGGGAEGKAVVEEYQGDEVEVEGCSGAGGAARVSSADTRSRSPDVHSSSRSPCEPGDDEVGPPTPPPHDTQLLADDVRVDVLPLEGVQDPAVDTGSASSAVLVVEATQQDARVEVEELIAQIPEYNAFHNRRSSVRLAGITSQRGGLPHPVARPAPRARTSGPSTGATKRKVRGRTRASKKGRGTESRAVSNTAEGGPSKARLKFRMVKEPEEVRRARLAYPPPQAQAALSRTRKLEVDYNEKDPVEWEGSLGRRVAVRMWEMGVRVQRWE